MANAYHGEPADVIAAAHDGYAVHGELEGYLSSWMGLKDDFNAAVNNNQTGAAIQNAMQMAHQSGTKLAMRMQELMDMVKDTGVKVDGQDLESASQVKFEEGIAAQGLGSNTQTLGTNGKLDLNGF